MIVGVPKEIKNSENRVGMTPAGVSELVSKGVEVHIEQSAGEGSGFSDDEYRSAGAKLVSSASLVYQHADMIVKVKEPLPAEYGMIQSHQTIFTYFHFAASKELTQAMIATKATCIAYETVELSDRTLPLLMPMSQVAGRMSVQEGARFLQRSNGGRGVLLGGVPGVKPGVVLVLGAGVVGVEAARMAAGLGAQVLIFDINANRLRELDMILPKNVQTIYSNQYNIKKELPNADLVIGAVLVPGGKAPKLITRDMLSLMKKGSVIVDVAVDQGGCVETCKPTTHADPVYEVDGVIHYGVANMPGAVPFTSTQALTNATLPYTVKLALQGWQQACANDQALAKGLNLVAGEVVYKPVADAFGLTLKTI